MRRDVARVHGRALRDRVAGAWLRRATTQRPTSTAAEFHAVARRSRRAGPQVAGARIVEGGIPRDFEDARDAFRAAAARLGGRETFSVSSGEPVGGC